MLFLSIIPALKQQPIVDRVQIFSPAESCIFRADDRVGFRVNYQVRMCQRLDPERHFFTFLFQLAFNITQVLLTRLPPS